MIQPCQFLVKHFSFEVNLPIVDLGKVVCPTSAFVSPSSAAASLSFWECEGPPFALLLVQCVILCLLLSREDPPTSTWASVEELLMFDLKWQKSSLN